MTKTIDTLVDDIYKVIIEDHTFSEDNVKAFGQKLATNIQNKLSRERTDPKLWMSNIGQPCERKLWYTINKPELAEALPREVYVKFLFGDILEELLLFLAKEAGHKIEGEQERIEINGVSGRRDAIIDGVIIDVKSCSSRAFDKFKCGLTTEDDDFGYLTQLNMYLYGSRSDPRVIEKDISAFLTIDKTLGHIGLNKQKFDCKDYDEEVARKKEIISRQEAPERAFTDKEEGKSGNRKLGSPCSYCPFKQICWPGVRTFIYSNGPMFLTVVNKLPKVPEVI
jgi:CRISPR/Cas system-associated exonuclease Cas4 (RecB family)